MDTIKYIMTYVADSIAQLNLQHTWSHVKITNVQFAGLR